MRRSCLPVAACLVAGMALAHSDRGKEARDVVDALYAAVMSADSAALVLPYPERYFFAAGEELAAQEGDVPTRTMLEHLRELYPPEVVCETPVPDPENPEFRGMITILHQCRQREPIRFELRADTDRQGAPLRIMRFRLAGDDTVPD